ncbi:MAG: FAD-binding oxidoreductase [Armatimonadetes bacterium]|nr:FAD-binding oxidoreductase [Armatimonadota bacterium]
MADNTAMLTVVPGAALDAAAVNRFRSGLRSEVIAPDDPGYESARHVYNAMIDRHPRLIVRCANVADVIGCVNFARENDLPLAVRGGGHNVAGFGTCDDGLVLDLSRMKGIRVDPAGCTVRAEGGCAWGDLDHATHAFGLATTGGLVSTTGIAGLSLGGGIGHLARRYGLACDNLLSVDLVTADGRFLTASAHENDDLFWALRGGGGNFGVATSFEYRLHPVSEVFGGTLVYPLERAGEVMRFYRDFITQAPEEISAFFGFHLAPPAPFVPRNLQGIAVCLVVVCYTGPMAQADEAVRPLRAVTPPLLDLLEPMPYPTLQSTFDSLVPPGLYNYWKSDFMSDLSDEALEVLSRYGPQVPTYQSNLHVYPLNGAVQRVGKEETAFNYRDVQFVVDIAAVYEDPGDTPGHTAWVRDCWSALHPLSAGATYVNFLMDEGVDRIRAAYGEHYDRLAALKRKYDPTNLFRINQNIKPAP